MAKKMTRDYPLPSSDGMMGGPGKPKYTAKDSTNYMSMHNMRQASFKKAVEAGNSYMGSVKRRELMKKMEANPFHNTFKSRKK
jgi:hypothetical protein